MSISMSPRDVASLRLKLHVLNAQLANTTNPNAMGSLLRQYIETTDKLYLTIKAGMGKAAATVAQAPRLAAPYVPGGAVISAAITGTGNLQSSAGG